MSQSTGIKREIPSRLLRRVFKMLPVVIQPKVIAYRNRLFRNGGPAGSDLLAIILTLGLMLGLYICCTTTIYEWNKLAGKADVTATLVGGAFGALFLLVFLSSSVSAIGSLFVSRDIERFLASPISPNSLLAGKSIEVAISTIWMLAVFFIPLYLAFGITCQGSLAYFIATPLLVGLLLAIAVTSGILVAILFCAVIPAKIGRNIFIVLFVLALGIMLASLRLVPTGSPDLLSNGISSHSLSLKVLEQRSMPTYWIGESLRYLVAGKVTVAVATSAVCVCTLIGLWVLTLFSFKSLFFRTYSRLNDHQTPLRLARPAGRILGSYRGTGRNRLLRALVTREFFSFTRDITHTVQLGMLLAICLLYLYSLQSIQPPTHVGAITLQLWDMCTIFSSVVLSSIIILSICARFVFPSVSLEGQSFWILQSAPLRSREILRAKHICWFIPTACMSSIIFSSGGLALGLEPILVLALCATGIIFSHGLVALGVGIGARFARFDWEHPTELSTSWGNLIYTGCGLIVIMLSLLPIGVMFGLFVFLPSQFQDNSSRFLLVGSCLGVVLLIHFVTGRIILSIGARALDSLRNR
jgi:ABC-2 type transport system permease protein